MSYEVRPLTDDADILPWVKIHYEAFLASDPYRWSHPPTARSFEQLAAGRRRKLHNPNSRLFKAIDTSFIPSSTSNANEVEKIVGVAVWTVYPEPLKPEDSERYADGVSVPIEGQNEDAMKAFRSGLYSARREVVGEKAHVLLDGIVVSPEYQRQGIGGLLMRWGLEEADRLGLPAFLEASEAGRGLYERHGFRSFREIPFDTRPFGGDHVKRDQIMVREPQSDREKSIASR